MSDWLKAYEKQLRTARMAFGDYPGGTDIKVSFPFARGVLGFWQGALVDAKKNHSDQPFDTFSRRVDAAEAELESLQDSIESATPYHQDSTILAEPWAAVFWHHTRSTAIAVNQLGWSIPTGWDNAWDAFVESVQESPETAGRWLGTAASGLTQVIAETAIGAGKGLVGGLLNHPLGAIVVTVLAFRLLGAR